MRISCKNLSCGKTFKRFRNGQRRFCSAECRINFDRAVTKLRYRKDPAFREAMKAQALQRYYRRQAEGSGTAP